MDITANDHPTKVVITDEGAPYANDHPFKVEIEGGGDYATKEDIEELDEKIAALATDISLKGSVPTYADLPTDPAPSDAYIAEDTGVIWVWTNDKWVGLNDSKKAIIGSTDPTTSTEGEPGQLYLNTTSNKLFYCAGETGDSYTWLSTGEVNTIESISVNGTAVTPDANKNVNLTIDGGVKILTTDDYNYPTDNPNSIALWLLKPGVYKLKGELRYRVTSSGSYYGYADKELVVIVSNFGSNTDKLILYPDTYRYNLLAVTSSGSTSTYSFSGGSSSVVLTGAIVRNNLTSTDTTFPLSANQGKVLNEKIEGRVIQNAGAPTTSTVGTVGMLLEDTTNGKLYQCTAIDNTDPQNIVYTWTEVGGGSGPAVVQTTGTSTTDVMSQNAVTEMVFADNNTRKIKIGDGTFYASGVGVMIGGGGTYVRSNNCVLVGDSSTISANSHGSVLIGTSIRLSNVESGTAIGYSASINSNGSKGAIAIGAYSSASGQGVMGIGSTNTSYGYNNSNYRLLTGLYDPQNDHDAATKGYVDGLVGNVESALNVINNGTGA